VAGVQQIEIGAADGEQRLDRWFKRRFPHLTHGRLEKLLRTGQVRIDGRRAKASDRLAPGQVVRVPPLPEEGPAPRLEVRPRKTDARAAETLRATVLYRDKDVIIINKPAGLAVQGGTGLEQNLDAMLDALRAPGAERPRLVHRLDRDTSGVLVLGASAQATRRLTESFRHKTARKIYWAVVVGVPKLPRGKIDLALTKRTEAGSERVGADPEEGKRAVTYYATVERAGKQAAWLALMPITGRTHQLRAHCLALGTPILGDGKYAGGRAFIARGDLPRQLHLHARALRMPHPAGGMIDVTAPLPPHMQATWRFFGFAPTPGVDPFADLDV